MPWAAAAAAAGAIGGALITSNATRGASDTQSQATKAGIAEQARQFDLTRADTAPYRAAGQSGIAQLQTLLGIAPKINDGSGPLTSDQVSQIYQRYMGRPVKDDEMQRLLGSNKDAASLEQAVATSPEAAYHLRVGGVNPVTQPLFSNGPQAANQADGSAEGSLTRKFSISDFWNDPVVQASYQSGLDLGTKALKNAAPLTTGLDSGAALKELTKFGTDYTGNMAAGSQARYVGDQANQFNKLAAMAGIGQVGVNTSAAAGTNSANNISNMLTSQGNAAGAAKIAGANAWGGGIQSVSNFWQQQQMMNRMYPQGGATTPRGYWDSSYNDTSSGAGGY